MFQSLTATLLSYVICFVCVSRHCLKNLPETPSRSGEDATWTGVLAAPSGNASKDGMRFNNHGTAAGRPRMLSPRRVSVGPGLKQFAVIVDPARRRERS